MGWNTCKFFICIITRVSIIIGNSNCRNVRGLGESMVVFCLFEKLLYSNKNQLNMRVAFQISPKIENLHGLGRQATKL